MERSIFLGLSESPGPALGTSWLVTPEALYLYADILNNAPLSTRSWQIKGRHISLSLAVEHYSTVGMSGGCPCSPCTLRCTYAAPDVIPLVDLDAGFKSKNFVLNLFDNNTTQPRLGRKQRNDDESGRLSPISPSLSPHVPRSVVYFATSLHGRPHARLKLSHSRFLSTNLIAWRERGEVYARMLRPFYWVDSPLPFFCFVLFCFVLLCFVAHHTQ